MLRIISFFGSRRHRSDVIKSLPRRCYEIGKREPGSSQLEVRLSAGRATVTDGPQEGAGDRLPNRAADPTRYPPALPLRPSATGFLFGRYTVLNNGLVAHLTGIVQGLHVVLFCRPVWWRGSSGCWVRCSNPGRAPAGSPTPPSADSRPASPPRGTSCRLLVNIHTGLCCTLGTDVDTWSLTGTPSHFLVKPPYPSCWSLQDRKYSVSHCSDVRGLHCSL